MANVNLKVGEYGRLFRYSTATALGIELDDDFINSYFPEDTNGA